jgi:hypothetical protein
MTERSVLEAGPQHEALAPLIGDWSVEMTTHGPDGAQRSDAPLRAEKSYFADGRYVLERITGAFAGAPHEKLSLLGFNNSRSRYEYVTADNHDAVLLLYATLPGASSTPECIDLFSEYVSPGDAAARGVLLTVRTRIDIVGHAQHRLTNFYAEPGGVERKFLEYVYRRRAQ